MRGNRLLLILVGILALALVRTSVGRELLLPEAEAERKAKRIVKLKKKAAGLGAGKKSKVVVRLINGTWMKGTINGIKGDLLELITGQQGPIISVDFSQIKQIS